MVLFDKKYDALNDPKHGLTNHLNGTCQEAQLLLQGYEQALTNGRQLREAYLFTEGTYTHEERMRLFDTSGTSVPPWDATNLYLRSDDNERTLMTGQVVLRGLFQPELEKRASSNHYNTYPTIPVHTADRNRDVMGGHAGTCPRLQELQREAESSHEYHVFSNSLESQEVQTFMKSQLASSDPGLFDCLMTTVCTDRPLPDALHVMTPNPHSWFHRIGTYVRILRLRTNIHDDDKEKNFAVRRCFEFACNFPLPPPPFLGSSVTFSLSFSSDNTNFLNRFLLSFFSSSGWMA